MIASKGLIKGMSQDSHPRYQPENTYHSALNAIIETTDGEIMSIANELGNLQELTTYPVNDDGIPKRIIGSRLLDDGTTVLFLFDPAETRPDHEIGIWDPKQKKYTTYVYGTCLNFSDKHYINAVYRLKNGCERVVYFTDNYNPYRVINLDRPEYYTAPPDTQLLDCDKLRFSRDYQLPDFEAEVLPANGILKVGTYSFVYRLLDDDGNATNWLFFTNPVSISDDNESILTDPGTVNNYDGGVSNSTETGFVEDTTKSIELLLTNVDARFKYFQIAVIKKLASDGSISGVDVLVPQIIPAGLPPTTTVSFIYTGQLSQIESLSSLEELLSEKLSVQQVAAHAIHDNRLVVANLSSTQKNLVGLQRHASAIKVEYVEVGLDVAEALSKDPNYYFNEAGFLHDEVYALAIVYVFEDGTVSPAFPIPGRPKIDNTAGVYGINPYNTDYSATWDDEDVTGDPNVFNSLKTSRWQVYNTFTEYDVPSATGLLGYYETDTTYPDINDCSDHPDGYWGRDWLGNLISAGDPIRHHRMPPSIKSNASSPAYIRKLGLKFTMIEEYPTQEGIAGHYFVYSDRTNERTILDRGMIVPIGGDRIRKGVAPYPRQYGYSSASDDYHLPSSAGILVGVPRQDHALYGFASPTTMYDGRMYSGSYLTLDRYHLNPSIYDTDTSYSYFTPNFDNIIYAYRVRVHQHEQHTPPLELNYQLKFSQWLQKAEVSDANTEVAPTATVPFGFLTNVKNLSINTDLGLVVLDRELAEVAAYPLSAAGGGSSIEENEFFKDGNGYTASIKADVSVFRNLDTIEYKRIGNIQLHKELGIDFEIELFDGDIFICPLDIVDYHWFVDSSDGDKTKIKASFVTTPIESTLNLGLRHGDTRSSAEFAYFKWNNLEDTEFFHRYVTTKYFTPVPDNPELFQFYPEAHLYSKAYSYLDSIYTYYPLTQDYDYCSECISEFPYRLYYSKLDDIERRMDAFREILPNNYADIDGTNGEITDMFVTFNQLYLTTPFATYKIPTNLQTLATEDGESVFVGSGNFFSTPARPLKTSDGAFAGQRLWKSRVQTEYGTFFMDTDSFRPILFSDQLKDLSLSGLRNFFQNNAKLKFLDQFKLLTGLDYTNLSTVSPQGIGYISVYDPRHKRIIVHKKDYTINESYANSFTYVPYEDTQVEDFEAPQALWFDGNKFYYNTSQVLLDNPLFFDNRSYTLSYSFLNNA